MKLTSFSSRTFVFFFFPYSTVRTEWVLHDVSWIMRTTCGIPVDCIMLLIIWNGTESRVRWLYIFFHLWRRSGHLWRRWQSRRKMSLTNSLVTFFFLVFKVRKEELQKMMADALPDHMKLRGGVMFLDQLPHTSSGKISRSTLRKLAESYAH